MDSIAELLAANPPSQLLTALGIAVATLAVIEIARRVIVRRLRGAHATDGPFDDLALKLASTMIAPVRWMFSLWVGSWSLTLPALWEGALGRVGVILVAIQLGRWGGAMVDAGVILWSRRAEAMPESQAANVMVVVRALCRGVLWIAMTLLVLENLGVDIAPLLTGLGVGGVAVALAVQSVVGDLLRSITILFDRPAAVGELVAVGDVRGHVEAIGLRSTRIRALSGEEVVVPNADLVNARVRNFRGQPDEATKVRLIAALSNPVERLQKVPGIATGAVAEVPGATLLRAGVVDILPPGVVVEVLFRTPNGGDLGLVERQRVLLALLGQLQEAGLVFVPEKV